MFQKKAIVLTALLAFSPIAGAAESILLGVFPRFNLQLTMQKFTPLAQYLSQQTGLDVKLETAPNLEAFGKSVADKRYHLVHYNQYNYVVSHQQQGYEVIAKNEEFGKSVLTGALVVRMDSGIETLADLKGKKIVFGGGPKSMQGYIIPKYLLMQAGLKTGDYQETTAKDPSNAAIGVFHKQADAGGVGDITLQLENLAGQIDASQLKYIATGEPMAHLPWAVRGDLVPELRAKLQAALIQMKSTPEGQKALEQAGFTNIVPATDADYQPHRRIIQAVHGENY